MENSIFINLRITLIILIAICVESCKHSFITSDSLVKFFTNKQLIVKEIYDSAGLLRSRQYFDKDTIPYGSKSEFYTNGKIRRWRWFQKDTIPECGAYYDTNGVVYAFRGNPFIKSGNETMGGIFVTMVNPPNARFVTVFKDSFDNKLISELVYEPVISDSNSYIVIKKEKNEYEYKSGHSYSLCFYIVDKEDNVLAGGETALKLVRNGYDFITAPPLPRKILISK